MRTVAYHNTTGISGERLQAATSQAESQQDVVYQFMRERSANSFTCCEVWQSLIKLKRIGKGTPVTSIRRAMDTLVKKEKVVQLKGKRMGYFNAPAFLHQVAGIGIQQSMFN